MARPGTFPKGVSGNPGGKPKNPPDLNIVQMCRDASPAIVRRLIKIANGDEEAELPVALKAAQTVLDRAFGTPRQSVELTGDVVVPFVMWLPKPADDADEWAKRQNGHASN